MSKENNYNHLAKKILELCGGKSNISSYTHCMTRLRITPYDESKADAQALRELDGVLGVVEAETIQIILGTGVVNHVTAAFSKLVSAEEGVDVKEAAAKKKADINRKNATPFKLFLRKIASIFIPLIPALVASGLITGITKAIIQAGWLSAESQIAIILTVIGSGLFTYLGILVGINASKEFGGTPALGALAGILIMNPEIAKISLFGEQLLPGRGRFDWGSFRSHIHCLHRTIYPPFYSSITRYHCHPNRFTVNHRNRNVCRIYAFRRLYF